MKADWARAYGPWALVTGASDGIGRAMAQEIARRGVNVILTARRIDQLEALATEIRKRHSVETRVIPANLAEANAPAQLMAASADLDIGLVVACAGFGTSGSIVATAMADEVEMVDLNCRALLVIAKHAAEVLSARGRGGIVLMSSIVAFQGVRSAANYAATKAYVQVLAEGMSEDLRQAGVDVIASAPGPVASGFAQRARMRMGRAELPLTVARESLDALGTRRTVRPGMLSKILGWSLANLPRTVRIRIMAGIMDGMTRHQHVQAPKKAS